jgi:hypothetical protein
MTPLDRRDDLVRVADLGEPLLGRHDELGAPVCGVGPADERAGGLQFVDQATRHLLVDARQPCELRGPDAGGVEEGEDRAVPRAELGVPPVAQLVEQLLARRVGEPRRHHGEVRSPALAFGSALRGSHDSYDI